MTDKEIVQALRCTSTPGGPTGDCEKCPYWKTEQLTAEQKEKLGVDTWTSCDVDKVGMDAADLIERLTADNEELRKEIEWKDMVIALAQRKQAEAEAERDALLEIAKKGKDCETCKNRAVCVKPGTDVAHWCDRCEEKCRCYGCGGDNWEWRGVCDENTKEETT